MKTQKQTDIDKYISGYKDGLIRGRAKALDWFEKKLDSLDEHLLLKDFDAGAIWAVYKILREELAEARKEIK